MYCCFSWFCFAIFVFFLLLLFYAGVKICPCTTQRPQKAGTRKEFQSGRSEIKKERHSGGEKDGKIWKN